MDGTGRQSSPAMASPFETIAEDLHTAAQVIEMLLTGRVIRARVAPALASIAGSSCAPICWEVPL